MTRLDNSRVIKAPTGPELNAKSWLTEAPLRMLMNNLDPDVAEHPQSLVVYGGIGRAARNWACYDKIVEVLTRLEDDQTLLVQSGKPVGVFQTHKDAPRVFIATNNAQVPHVEGSGAFDNLLAPTAEGHLGGLSILNSVVNLPTAQLPGVHYVLLSGAGYTIDPHGRSMFKWTNPQQLSRIARNLSFGAELVGLDPGQTLTATGEITNSDFVVLGSTEPGTAAAPLDEVLAKPRAILPPAATDELTILVDDILAELNGIAPVLINSRFGRALLNVNTYLSGPTGPVRFALHLRHGDHAATIGFDVNTSAFTRIEGEVRIGDRVVILRPGGRIAQVGTPQEILADPADDVTLVVTHASGNKGKKVLDTLKKAKALVLEAPAIKSDRDKADFVTNEFRRSRRKATSEAVQALVEAVGKDVRELASACQQLVDDTTGTIDADVVERYHGGRVEATGFKVADAAVAGQTGEALRLLRHAVNVGVDPVPIVAALAQQLRQLAKVGGAGRGRSADLARDLGMAPWQVDKARRSLQGWTGEGLGRSIQAVAAADFEVKGGGRDPVYAVERAILVIAAKGVTG